MNLIKIIILNYILYNNKVNSIEECIIEDFIFAVPVNTWKCKDTSNCILESYVCNGVYDCADGSDENVCCRKDFRMGGLNNINCIDTKKNDCETTNILKGYWSGSMDSMEPTNSMDSMK